MLATEIVLLYGGTLNYRFLCPCKLYPQIHKDSQQSTRNFLLSPLTLPIPPPPVYKRLVCFFAHANHIPKSTRRACNHAKEIRLYELVEFRRPCATVI